jgi:hypothetical protein
MFDVNRYTLHEIDSAFADGRSDAQYLASRQAQRLYQNARVRACLREAWARLTRRPAHLSVLKNTLAPYRQGDGYFIGIRAVPLAQIRGSENRSADFDASFDPCQTHTEARWLGVATARLQGTPLPPVTLIQVGNAFYVRDGHHRISVAHALGEVAIDAEVILCRVSPAHANATSNAPKVQVMPQPV